MPVWINFEKSTITHFWNNLKTNNLKTNVLLNYLYEYIYPGQYLNFYGYPDVL